MNYFRVGGNTETYLRVECPFCGADWNYYQEIADYGMPTTAVKTLGGKCPQCGSIVTRILALEDR